MLIKGSFLEWDKYKNAYCWYIPFHRDDVDLGPNGTYTIKIVQHKEGVLVHRVNGRYEILELKENYTYTFVAKHRHAYLPMDVALEVIRTQSITPANVFFKHIPRTSKERELYMEPKEHLLVFKFVG